ncbi:RnfABCDGE type electron transport complex subunit D [Verrucomicrobiota bacterium]
MKKLYLISVNPEHITHKSGMLPSADVMNRYLKPVFWLCLPLLLLSTYYFQWKVITHMATAFLGYFLVDLIFSRIRKKAHGGASLTFALLLTLLMPSGVPHHLVFVGAVFGAVFAKEIFGGTGYHLFSPVIISKGFLFFSYPTLFSGPDPADTAYFASLLNITEIGWATCSAIILLLALVLICIKRSNAFIIIPGLLTAYAVSKIMLYTGAFPFSNFIKFMAADGFVFVLCFLATDPATSPGNNKAKCVYGIIIGIAAALMRTYSIYAEAMLFAVLLGNLMTPLLQIMFVRKKKINLT